MEKEFTEDEELLYLASYVVKQGIYDEIVFVLSERLFHRFY